MAIGVSGVYVDRGNSVDVGFVSNRVRFHVAEHLLFQLRVHLVRDGHHVGQQFAVFELTKRTVGSFGRTRSFDSQDARSSVVVW